MNTLNESRPPLVLADPVAVGLTLWVAGIAAVLALALVVWAIARGA